MIGQRGAEAAAGKCGVVHGWRAMLGWILRRKADKASCLKPPLDASPAAA
jgi:hypothetical protein